MKEEQVDLSISDHILYSGNTYRSGNHKFLSGV